MTTAEKIVVALLLLGLIVVWATAPYRSVGMPGRKNPIGRPYGSRIAVKSGVAPRWARRMWIHFWPIGAVDDFNFCIRRRSTIGVAKTTSRLQAIIGARRIRAPPRMFA